MENFLGLPLTKNMERKFRILEMMGYEVRFEGVTNHVIICLKTRKSYYVYASMSLDNFGKDNGLERLVRQMNECLKENM